MSRRESSANGHRYWLDGFEVDPQNRLLQRDGANILIPAKVFDVLLVFAENTGRTAATGFPSNPLLEHDSYIARIRQTPAFTQFIIGQLDQLERYRQEFGD